MSATPPPSLTPAPTPAPQRGDRTTFANRVDAFVTWLITAVTQLGLLATNVYNNAVVAFDSATTAAAAAESAAFAANAVLWVGDTVYEKGENTISPSNLQTYRRKVTGAGTTDPALDPSNWVTLIGANTGDVLTTARALTAPDWLLCDSATYLQSSYNNLSDVLGPGISQIELADPTGTAPAGGCYGGHFSPDGTYLSMACAATPFIFIYKRTGDTFAKLANPATLPTGAPSLSANSTAWSPDGIHLAIAHNASPYVTIYKRAGDAFTKLANPAVLPVGNATAVLFSPDGLHLLVGHSGGVTLYSVAGDVFTNLGTAPVPTPAATQCLGFSPDGVYLATGHGQAPFVNVFKRAGDAYTKLADIAGSTVTSGVVYSLAFHPDGVHLAYPHTGKTVLVSRSGDAFTEVSATANTIATGGAMCWVHGGEFLLGTGGLAWTYSRFQNGTLTDVPFAVSPSAPTLNVRGPAASPDDMYTAIFDAVTPYIPYLYKLSYDPLTEFVVPMHAPTDSKLLNYIKT